MTLPDIPDEASLIVALAYHDCDLAGRGCMGYSGHDVDTAHGVLVEVMPHLYAAVLRHAAETLFQPEPSVPAAILRQAADEASA